LRLFISHNQPPGAVNQLVGPNKYVMGNKYHRLPSI